MNESLRDLLRQGANSVEPPRLEVGDLVAEAERTLARRRIATLAVSALVVVLIAAGSFALGSYDKGRPTPAPPGPSRTEHGLGADRALAYAEGETIHRGDQTIDVGRVVTFVEGTDDGVVFITEDDNRLWFTDGAVPAEIGKATIRHVYSVPVVTANPGSLVAWVGTRKNPSAPDGIVIYDTSTRRVVARLPTAPADFAAVAAVNGDRVYWTRGSRTAVMRYDVSTGKKSVISIEAYHEELATNPRMLAIGKASYDPPEPTVSSVSQRLAYFKHVGRRLVASDSVSRGAEGNTMAPTTLLDGRPLRLRVPKGYGGVQTFAVVQWIDDDHLALFAYHEHNEYPRHFGDLLVCPVPTGTCRVVVPASDSTPYVPPGEVP